MAVLIALVSALVVTLAGAGSPAERAGFVYDGDSVTAAVHVVTPNLPTDLHVSRQALDARGTASGYDDLDNMARASARSAGYRLAPRAIPGVQTPNGLASQATSRAAMAARSEVESGASLWRIGTTGRSAAGEAQFWALEHPLTPGFAARHGIPARNVLNADFIESAVLRPGSPFITRGAPGVGTNLGGAIEVVVPEGGVWLRGFSWFGQKGAL